MSVQYVRSKLKLSDEDITGVWLFEDELSKSINITLDPEVSEVYIDLAELKALVVELEGYTDPKAAQNPPATGRD